MAWFICADQAAIFIRVGHASISSYAVLGATIPPHLARLPLRQRLFRGRHAAFCYVLCSLKRVREFGLEQHRRTLMAYARVLARVTLYRGNVLVARARGGNFLVLNSGSAQTI